jgi:hypothetical protein
MSDFRQCDACGRSVKGNLTPKPHACPDGVPCKPRNHPEACSKCADRRARQDTIRMARILGAELVKNC